MLRIASEYLRATLPNTCATFLPGEGHFYVLKRQGEILATLGHEPEVVDRPDDLDAETFAAAIALARAARKPGAA